MGQGKKQTGLPHMTRPRISNKQMIAPAEDKRIRGFDFTENVARRTIYGQREWEVSLMVREQSRMMCRVQRHGDGSYTVDQIMGVGGNRSFSEVIAALKAAQVFVNGRKREGTGPSGDEGASYIPG